MENRKILIVDPDREFLRDFRSAVTQMGHEITCTPALNEGLQNASTDGPDVVIVNAEMPDGNAIECLSSLLQAPSQPEVIVVSRLANPDEAELAIRSGAWDYLEKPANASLMTLPVIRALEYRAKKPKPESCPPLLKETFRKIAGTSPLMRSCLEVVALAANSEASVLISGETGTGKELFAWAIHNNSSRAGNQFVVVDCASLPPALVESTLFGYEKGAFTGADRPHKGLIKRADGGTLFLDEIGELPLSIQKSFLRVLQEKKFRQVGGRQEVRSNFRVIAATNRDLDQMVQRRQFRKDLLFRLRSFGIDLPPLRERLDDIPGIAKGHLERFYATYNTGEKQFSPDFFATLARYEWPGNVRELVNALERAVSAARHEPILFPKHLPTYIRVHLARSIAGGGTGKRKQAAPIESPPLPTIAEARDMAIARTELKYLRDLIALTGGDIDKAKRISGLSRSRLYGLLKKYGIRSSPAGRD